jgi:hypothetical protein
LRRMRDGFDEIVFIHGFPSLLWTVLGSSSASSGRPASE